MAEDTYDYTITFPLDLADKLKRMQKALDDDGFPLSFNKLVLRILKQADEAGLLDYPPPKRTKT